MEVADDMQQIKMVANNGPERTPVTHNAFVAPVRATNGLGIAWGFIARCACGWARDCDTQGSAALRVNAHLAVARHLGETVTSDQREALVDLIVEHLDVHAALAQHPDGLSASDTRAKAERIIAAVIGLSAASQRDRQ